MPGILAADVFVFLDYQRGLRPWRPGAFTMPAALADERSKASQAMDAYADGDDSAFGLVYDELAPRLYAYVRRMTRSDTVAEDIIQQVFLNIHQARAQFVRGARAEPWSYAIARRLTIDWARSRRHELWFPIPEDGLPSPAQGPEMLAALSELTDALEKEIDSVPQKLREAFLLVRIEGLSTADAAEVLGTTAMAVKLRAHRAGVMLRPRLADFAPGRLPDD